MALCRSMLALAIMMIASATLCGAAEADYPKSPVPTKEEFEAIEQKANAGDAESQRYVGVFYANGTLVDQDHVQAAKWLKKASDNGDAKATVLFGILNDFGLGVAPDKKIAFDCYMQAIQQGDWLGYIGVSGILYGERHDVVDATLGYYASWSDKALILADAKDIRVFFSKYHSVDKYYLDYSNLIEAIKKKAQNGSSTAEFDLAIVYATGICGIADRKLSSYWLEKAAIDNPYAQYILGREIYFGLNSREKDKKKGLALIGDSSVHGTSRMKLAYAQLLLEERPQEALSFLIELAEEQYAPARWKLGLIYLEGKYSALDQNKAFSLIHDAATAGIEPAAKKMTELYFFGIGTDVGFEQGLYWLNRALHHLDGDFLYQLFEDILAEHNKRSLSVAKEFESYMTITANSGDGAANVMLGWIELHRKTVNNNVTKNYFKRAIDCGVTVAGYLAGQHYADKKSPDFDEEKATEYYLMAAKHDDPVAEFAMGMIHWPHDIKNLTLTSLAADLMWLRKCIQNKEWYKVEIVNRTDPAGYYKMFKTMIPLAK